MAKRRSKIKTGGRIGPRVTRRKDPAKEPVSTRILTQKLDLNSVPPYDETCQGKDIHEEEVKGLDDIDTKTATAEHGEDYLSENIRSADGRPEGPANIKKSPAMKGKSSHLDKAPCTCPREVDGEQCLDVECGNNNALLYLNKLCVGSKGACIKHDGAWLTPNEFQFVSGRETAKDWKRSIRHNGFSLKLLIVNGCIELNASPPASALTAAVAPSNNIVKKAETVVKPDKTSNGTDTKKRRYIPVKRRNAAIKDKVVGRRKNIKRAKKQAVAKKVAAPPTLECQISEEPVVEAEKDDKACAVEATCPSIAPVIDAITDEKEEHVEDVADEKQSEEFFKVLQLSKTPSSTTANSPVAADLPDTDIPAELDLKEPLKAICFTGEGENNEQDTCNSEKNAETSEEQTPKVVETFRSRLIADNTRLRIAINREVVCMNDKMMNDTAPKKETVTDACVPKSDANKTIASPSNDLSSKKAEQDTAPKTGQKLLSKVSDLIDCAVGLKPSETVKTELVTDSKELALINDFSKPFFQNDFMKNISKPSVQTNSEPCFSKHLQKDSAPTKVEAAKVPETKPDIQTSPMEPADIKCDDIVDSKVAGAVKDFKATVNSPRSFSTTNSARDSVNYSATSLKPCFKQTATVSSSEYLSSCGKDAEKASTEAKVNKHLATNSIKCHRKNQDSRSTPKSVAESTFQDKSQYENDMLELMSIYRPVMVPCDGRCPYVCSDSTSPRQLGDVANPYLACTNNKWPTTSPFLSGVMTPEMMYYMTQQLYFDMYNSSLYAQCSAASETATTQPKPQKRKAPEPDQDSPLDLTVKKAKMDRINSNVHFTQDMDSPVDFSKHSSYHYDKRVHNIGKHSRTPHNGAIVSNGYKAKPSPQPAAEKPCTCGKKDDIRNWNVEKVCNFLKQYTDCAIYTKTFREQGIDGRLLPYLTMQHLTRTLGMQAGPASTFLCAVDQRLRGNAPQRYCQWCKG